MTNWIKELPNKNRCVYSQGGQDGIIEWIAENIQIDNKFCVEFGYNAPGLTGGSGPNCGNLVIHKGWKNLFLGGDHEIPEINLYRDFLTTENILEVFRKYGVPSNPGYISVDVDSTDLWLLDKLLEEYSPSFFSVEFNPNIPHNYAIAFPNDPKECWQGTRVMGSSLKCFDIVSKKHGYSLVYAGSYSQNGHHDAFFVRNDLIEGMELPALEDFNHTHEFLHHPEHGGRHQICLDYEHWLVHGDVVAAQQAALPITTKYLT
jgi:hypothetical protein